MTDIKEKACRSCRKIKPVDDYYENKYSPDGRYAFCKVCFDQFAKKLKEKEQAAAPLDKICEKCGKTRLIEEFEGISDASGTKPIWCKTCRQQEDDAKKTPNKKMKPSVSKPLKPPKPKAAKKKSRDPSTQKSGKPEPTSQPIQKAPTTPVPKSADQSANGSAISPKPQTVSQQDEDPADDFDFIEYLLEKQEFEKRAALDLLQIPKQITKIKVRKRVCNGCGKTEEIDQVEKNTVIPVHAWFCGYCRQKTARRLVRKGITVQDYWGREFKIKKIISNDLVMGVLKSANGKWEKKPQKIYGSWKTTKK